MAMGQLRCVLHTKSAYRAFLNGATTFDPWWCLWKSWAPAKCKVFLWVPIRNKCWTANRLARTGLPHPSSCVLCDQTDEDIHHVLTNSVLAREFWFNILEPAELVSCVPGQDDEFAEWRKARKRCENSKRKDLSSMIILGAWILWKHKPLRLRG